MSAAGVGVVAAVGQLVGLPGVGERPHRHHQHHDGQGVETEQQQPGGAGTPRDGTGPEPPEPEQGADGDGDEQQHDAEELAAQRRQQRGLLDGPGHQVEQLHRHPGPQHPPGGPQGLGDLPGLGDPRVPGHPALPVPAQRVEQLGHVVDHGPPRRSGTAHGPSAGAGLQPGRGAQLGGVGDRVAQVGLALREPLGEVRLQTAEEVLALLLGQVGEPRPDLRDEGGHGRAGLHGVVHRSPPRVAAPAIGRVGWSVSSSVLTVRAKAAQSSRCCLSWARPVPVMP